MQNVLSPVCVAWKTYRAKRFASSFKTCHINFCLLTTISTIFHATRELCAECIFSYQFQTILSFASTANRIVACHPNMLSWCCHFLRSSSTHNEHQLFHSINFALLWKRAECHRSVCLVFSFSFFKLLLLHRTQRQLFRIQKTKLINAKSCEAW